MAPSSAFTARHPSRTLLGVAVPSASLPAHSPVAPATHAAIGGCPSDLVVTLSNGDMLDLHASVDDAYTTIQLVSYTVHARVGTRAMGAVDTSLLGPHDTFQLRALYADERPNTSSAGVKVSTGTPQVPVAATTDLVSVNGTLVAMAWASGQCPQMLWMNRLWVVRTR